WPLCYHPDSGHGRAAHRDAERWGRGWLGAGPATGQVRPIASRHRPGSYRFDERNAEARSVTPHHYGGPSVYGYETDRPLRRAASICVHTSPLATLGGQDAGGMNVYVRELACHVARLGLP